MGFFSPASLCSRFSAFIMSLTYNQGQRAQVSSRIHLAVRGAVSVKGGWYKGVARTGRPPASMFLKYASHLRNTRAVLFCKRTSRKGVLVRVTPSYSSVGASKEPAAASVASASSSQGSRRIFRGFSGSQYSRDLLL